MAKNKDNGIYDWVLMFRSMARLGLGPARIETFQIQTNIETKPKDQYYFKSNVKL